MAGQMVCCLSWLGMVSELFEGLLSRRVTHINLKLHIACHIMQFMGVIFPWYAYTMKYGQVLIISHLEWSTTSKIVVGMQYSVLFSQKDSQLPFGLTKGRKQLWKRQSHSLQYR